MTDESDPFCEAGHKEFTRGCVGCEYRRAQTIVEEINEQLDEVGPLFRELFGLNPDHTSYPADPILYYASEGLSQCSMRLGDYLGQLSLKKITWEGNLERVGYRGCYHCGSYESVPLKGTCKMCGTADPDKYVEEEKSDDT